MSKNLIASIIFAAGAFMFFVLVLPQYDSISAARSALKTRELLLEEKKKELGNIDKLNKEYKTRQADIDKITVLMPTQKRIDEIVSSIQQIASQTGFNLISITTAGSAETGTLTGYRTVVTNFDVAGQYPSFIDFLKLLEQNLRLYDIFEIVASLAPATGGGAQNLVNFTVKLNAYNLQ